jgi:chloramphenicol 3-O phosphotransferase
LYEPRWAGELAQALEGLTAYFVGVRLPLSVLEERERARATSPVGHARSHYQTVHAHGVYDLEIDSSRASPDQCATAIMAYVRAHPQPTAFEKLRQLR